MMESDRTDKEAKATGYLHPRYAEALAEFGQPRELPRSKGWILQRRIPNSPYYDGMGCYPLFACRDWSQLALDLEELGEEQVSLSLVTDPFGEYDVEYLRECFGDVVNPFKQHFVVDLDQPLESFVHSHHRRNARRALRQVQVEKCADAASTLEEWTALYATLTKRHHITGITAFSRKSFAEQLAVPGITAFRATNEGSTVGMLLWYVQGKVAYYHLGAYSERGYELRASFALFSHALEYFAQEGSLSHLNLGGGAGIDTNGTSGLSRFKEGWSNNTRMAYFCGKIFDRRRYIEVSKARDIPPTEHFPAYRWGEFSNRTTADA